jgi:hypothetical protein
MIIDLPTIDGNCLLFDNSAIDTFECPRKGYYSFVRKREGGERGATNFGSAMHLYWKVHYRGVDLNEDKTNRLLSAYFRRKPQPEGEWRTTELAQCGAKVYEEKYQYDDFIFKLTKPRKVEQSFLLPFGQIGKYKIFYMGRIDLQEVLHEDSYEWIVDHKTNSQFGNSFKAEQAMTAQHRGYCWARQQVTGILPRGYCVNAFRTRTPRKIDEYDPTKGIRPDDFDREWFYVSQADINEWFSDTFDLIDNIIYMANKGKFPMFRKQCVGKYGICTYYDVCSMPQASREGVLASSLYREKTWSPLNKV